MGRYSNYDDWKTENPWDDYDKTHDVPRHQRGRDPDDDDEEIEEEDF